MSILVKYFLLGFFVVHTIWNSYSYQYTSGPNKTLLRLRRQLQEEHSNEKLCSIPAQPADGHWFYLNTSEPVLPLQKVPVNTTIGFKCSSGYLLSLNNEDTEFFVCRDGEWNLTSIPFCNKLCPPFYNSSVITVNCENKDTGLTVACDKATDGTLLSYECALNYEPSSSPQSDLQCFNGTWDYLALPLCTPECGKKNLKAIPLIVGGQKSKRSQYPWVVALYSSRESGPYFTNICGGTLLTTDIVLTAAHCVTRQYDGRTYKTKYFRISVGKFFNEYEDSRDNDTAQYSKVQLIMKHPEYKGERQHFRFDIAILKLQTTLNLSNIVQPACYRDIKKYLPETDAVRLIGSVSGWGYTTSKGEPSDILKEVTLPLRDRDKCYEDFDQDWADQFFTNEKLCAGYLNQNTSVCKGDSGGGLVLQEPNSRKYYVYGIVSLGRSFVEDNEKHCDIQRSALFTKVDVYSEWLQTKIAQLSCDKCQNNTIDLSTDGCDFCLCFQKFCPLSKLSSGAVLPRFRGPGCVAPAHPTHGSWVYLHNNIPGLVGEKVPLNIIIKFTCHEGYSLPTAAPLIVCGEKGWSVNTMPECGKRLCPPISSVPSTTYKCLNQEGLEISCEKAQSGTYLTVQCDTAFSVEPHQKNRIYCIDGSWDTIIPQCRSECGKKRVVAATLLKNENNITETSVDPWAVLIYSNRYTGNFEYICSATLLKDDIVITAGHCVSANNGTTENATYYKVGAGKFYSVYMDTTDVQSQYRNIEEIVVHLDYRGEVGNYRNDLAILKLESNFQLSASVLPVCFEDLSFSVEEGAIGSVTAWGYSISSEKTTKPKVVNVPLLSFSACYNAFVVDWASKYVTTDKICAGYLDERPTLCQGDSGAGLIIKHPNFDRYFIHGVASISYIEDSTLTKCSKNGAIIFTDIRSHFSWLQKQVTLLHGRSKNITGTV